MTKLKSALAGVALVAVSAGCSATSPTTPSDGRQPLSGALTSFESCDEALAELRAQATAHAPPTGGPPEVEAFADDAMPGTTSEEGARGVDPTRTDTEHSDTNTQEAGIDEPDIVKTDGQRVVAVVDGVVRVVDAATGDEVAKVKLAESTYGMSDLLLFGDRALIITNNVQFEAYTYERSVYGTTTLHLVDLSQMEVLNQFAIEGAYLDARAIDGVVRVVVRSQPEFETDSTAEYRDAIESAPIDNWLPDYELDGDSAQIECTSLARPAEYSGTSLMTLLTFDMAVGLDDGTPVTIAADGDTVYGTSDALYVANDRREFAALAWDTPVSAETELYRFSLPTGTAPVLDASGTVPGYLLNQYSLSQWNGHLRVATTDAATGESSSAVYVLAIGEGDLTEVGRVEGLGLGERIYAVRYVGDTGYVVTFRQVDPLYVLDLADPAAPKATGELKITGYSSYLHPVADDRLLGVGQEADDNGVTQGTQVSLFDVSDPAAPTRLDQHHLPGASSKAEADPHSFLYWEEKSIMVIPVRQADGGSATLVLDVGDSSLTEVANVGTDGGDVKRNFIVGDNLWTLSDGGFGVTSLTDYDSLAWYPF